MYINLESALEVSVFRLPCLRADRRVSHGLALAWIATVVAISFAARARPAWVVSLAASPDRVREGKLWFLVSSAMLVDRPVAISVICFVALGVLALALGGPGAFWRAALLGQVGATLLVYAVVGAIRGIVPTALGSVVASPDFGVSAISAAWLGAVATVGWRSRARTAIGRLWIAIGCIAVGLFAYSVRPDVTVLSSEHLVAFALGVSAAIPGMWTRALDRTCRRPLNWSRALFASIADGRTNAIAAAMLILALVVVAVTAAPIGVAALREQIASHLQPTLGRCASDWNQLRDASRPAVRYGSRVSLATTRRIVITGFASESRPTVWAHYCRYAFVEKQRVVVVLGLWQRGRVERWDISSDPHAHGPDAANAELQRNGHLRLVNHKGRLVLAS